MQLHLGRAPLIGAAEPSDEAAREPVIGVSAEPRGREASRRGAERGDHASLRAVGRLIEIDLATPIAELGVAAILNDAAFGLLQLVGEPAHLAAEMMLAARNFSQVAIAHQDALLRVRPVHAVDLDQRVVEQAGGEIGLVQALRLQRALDIECIDVESDGALDLRAGEAAHRLELGAVEGKIAVVIGEAKGFAVIARDAPAPAQRRRARIEWSCNPDDSTLIA